VLARLAARNFRNLEPLSWQPGPGRHLLLGDNGAGKTSLLEAIYVLATTRSFRTAQLADCGRHGGGGFDLAGEIEGQARVRLEVDFGAGGRRRAVNGVAGPLAEHLGVLPVVAWTEADAAVLTGGPQHRRRLLDRGVLGVKPAALGVLVRYRRALVQKRRLLLDRGEGLEPWNEVLAPAAAELIAQRDRYAALLGERLRAVLGATGLPFPPVELVYRPSPAAGREGPAAIAAALARARGEERRRRQPLVGPHRDELEVLWGGRELRRVASAGECKALALALTAAHGQVLEGLGRRPLYLLDDADVELSQATLGAVWGALGAPPQLFASSNRPAAFEDLEVTARWRLAGGRVEGS
jgi:DNA replication and repair protein RecF